MDRKVILDRAISERIGSFGLPRAIFLRLLDTIHFTLAPNYQAYRNRRDPEDVDCFRYRIDLPVLEENCWHTFYLRVNDTISPDHLIIEDISHDIFHGE